MQIKPQKYPNSLREHRKAAGLRQHEVAKALGLKSTDRISRWENGAAVPHIKNLFHLAVILKTSPQVLYDKMYEAIVNPNSSSTSEVVPKADMRVEA